MSDLVANTSGLLAFLATVRNNSSAIALQSGGAANNSTAMVVDGGPSNNAPALALGLGGGAGNNHDVAALGGRVGNNDVVEAVDGDAATNDVDGGGIGGYGPCGACKFLKRKCLPSCAFAPYFDSGTGCDEFAVVHKIFGTSNVSKLLLRIPEDQRREFICSAIYEAQARLKDPIYGCYGVIFGLQQEVTKLQAQISHVKACLEAIKRPLAQPPTPELRALSPGPDDLALTLSLPEAPGVEHGESSRNQALNALNPIGKGKQVEVAGASYGRNENQDTVMHDIGTISASTAINPRVPHNFPLMLRAQLASLGYVYRTPSDIARAKSTLKDIFALSLSAFLEQNKKTELFYALKFLLGSTDISSQERAILSKVQFEICRLIGEYRLAKDDFNTQEEKIKKRDKKVVKMTVLKESQDRLTKKEASLFEDNKKIMMEIQHLKNKLKENKDAMSRLMQQRAEEEPLLKKLKASVQTSAGNTEGWLMAKGVAERKMMEASREWESFRSIF